MITNYTDRRHDRLHRRALELQPAIAAAAKLADTAGCKVLYEEYMDLARSMRVGARDAWMVFGIASINWPLLLIDERAERDGIDVETAAQATILATKEWVAQRD